MLREIGNAVLWILVPEKLSSALPVEDAEDLITVDDAEVLLPGLGD